MNTQEKSESNVFLESERKLLALLSRQRECDVDVLTRSLDLNAEDVIKTASALSKKGYRITFELARNVLRLLAEGEGNTSHSPDVGDVLDHFKIGVIAETRIGAKQEQISLLYGVYEHLFARIGVAFVIFVGNLFVGKPDSSGAALNSIRPDVFLLTAEEQRDFAEKHFPTAGKKIKTYFVAGRRDLTFRGKEGYNILHDLCQRRSDLVYCGAKIHTFDVRGLKITAVNPYDDNGPQGKTLGPQQIADSLDDPHPDILLVSGMHRYAWIPDYWNDGWGFLGMVPSLHTQMTRQSNKRAPVRPDIGVAVLDINFNERDKNGKPKVLYQGYNLNPHADYSRTEHLEPYPRIGEAQLSQEESRILRLIQETSEFGITLGEITRRVKLNKQKVEAAIERFREIGFPISLPPEKKRVIMQQGIRQSFPSTRIEVARETHVGVVSDTHLTSTHQQIKLLRRSYEIFGERGISVVFHGGDLSEGPPSSGYRGHMRDVVGTNIDHLRDYVRDRYPRLVARLPDGTTQEGKTVAVAGNHDDWGKAAGGLDFVQSIVDRRPDIEYLGNEYGSKEVDGVYYYLLHPKGGSGDTLSRKLEMHISRARNRASKGKGKPRVFVLGNWHQAIALFARDILGFLAPCMKAEDEFHATLGLVPKLGFWIIHLGLDERNNIVSFIPEYFGFSEEEIDPWDYTDIHRWEIERAEQERQMLAEGRVHAE